MEKFCISVLERLQVRVCHVRRNSLRTTGSCTTTTPPHSSFIVPEFLTKKGILTMPHLLNSTNVAHGDFVVFLKMNSLRRELIVVA